MAFKVVLSLSLALLALVQAGPGIDVVIEGRNYFVSDDKAGAFEAIRVCDGKGMHLINLETKNESIAIFDWLQAQPDQVDKVFWTGASRRSGDDQWVWTVAGNAIVEEMDWAPGFPSIDLEFDAEVTLQGSNGGWSDASTFGLRMHQFCEKYE